MRAQNARRASTELPWIERPMPELLRLAWPIAISTLSYSVMTLVDTMFVGQLGASALAGVGLGGEGFGTYSIASPTGEGLTSPRTFTRQRRCALVDYFRIT